MGNILTKQFYRQRKDFEDSCAGRDAGQEQEDKFSHRLGV